MKKRNKIIIALVVIIAIIVGLSIFLKPNPIGIYTAKNNLNTIDTIIIFADNSYERRIYNAKSCDLVFENNGKWESNKNRIVFYDFYPNNDTKINKSFNNNDLLVVFSVKFEKSFGRVVFDYYDGTEKFRYYKSYF